jgi:hypothetical protein
MTDCTCDRLPPLCSKCVGTIRGALMELPDLVADLRTQPVGSAGPRISYTKKPHAPLPINVDAVDQEHATHASIAWWCQLVTSTWCPETPVGAWCTVCDHPSCVIGRVFTIPPLFPARCAWLRRHATSLARHDLAHDFYEDMTILRAALRRIVDRPASRRFVGYCTQPCGAPLMAVEWAGTVECRVCGVGYDAEVLRAGLLGMLRGELLTVHQMTQELPRLAGVRINANTIKTWKRRGKLAPRNVSTDGRQKFLLGDVLDLIKTEGSSL